MALSTTSDYGTAARILLQDQTAPLRFADSDLALALSIALKEAQRLRPDLFLGTASSALQTFTTLDNTAVTIDGRYAMALVYYMAGWTQMRDDEYTQDSRAAVFIQKFAQILTGGG